MSAPIRVLVVDDSALMRKLIPQIVSRDSSIQVVGTAMDGAFALAKIEEVKPQVITLDLEMPRMDGMETLRQITRKHRIPVLVVSAHTTEGAAATFKALAIGAFDFVAKPADAASVRMEEVGAELIAKIKVAAAAGMQEPPAPALREATTSRCSGVSADGVPRPATTRVSASISRMSSGVRAPLCAPLRVIASRSGSRLVTALKLPLVPSTHPRASKRRPTSISCRVTSATEHL